MAIHRSSFVCVYIRPTGDQFELVIQWIETIGTDFTFDEEVLLTSNTPRALLAYFHDPDFDWPVRPSLRS